MEDKEQREIISAASIAKLDERIESVEAEISRKEFHLQELAADSILNISTIQSQLESIAIARGRLRGLLEAQRLIFGS